jgi:hypothetical protein
MAKRQVFFSFEYARDNWRASQVRNMGKVDKSSTFCDNDWEEVRKWSSFSIRRWIDSQLKMRSCLVVLIGTTTSTRPWVKYEIQKAYEMGKGIVGIYIHNLKDAYGNQSSKGCNPFYNLYTRERQRLSNHIVCFESSYKSSKNVYDDINNNIGELIEDAIAKAKTY